jgi:O-antigen/teichoic acid export membrane protein
MRLARAGARILFSRVGQVLANAAVVYVVANTLGPKGQGHYSLTTAGVQLLASVLGGGMGLAAVPPLRQAMIPVFRMFRAQISWVLGMFLVLVLLAWGTLAPEPARFFADHVGWHRGWGFLAALAAAGMLTFEVFSYDLLARGRLVIGSAVNGYRAMGHLGVVLLAWGLGKMTLGLAVGAFALAQALGGAFLVGLVIREFRHPRHEQAQRGPADLPVEDIPEDLGSRSMLGLMGYNMRRGWLGQLSGVAYFLLLRLDLVLLEHFRDAREVGIYSVSYHLGEMLWLLPGAITPLLVHTSAAGSGDRHKDRTAIKALQAGFLVTLAVALPLYFLSGPLLEMLFGDDFAGSAAALRALLPGIVAFSPGVVLAGDFIGRGKPHWNTQASVATVAVNLGVGWVLIPTHGPVGAAWASTIAYSVGSAIMLWRFRRVVSRLP